MCLGWRKNCQIKFRVQFGGLCNTSGCLNETQRSEINALCCNTSLKCVLWYNLSYACSFLWLEKKIGRERQSHSARLFLAQAKNSAGSPSFLCFLRGDVRHAAPSNSLRLKLWKRGDFRKGRPADTYVNHTGECVLSLVSATSRKCARDLFVWNPCAICSVSRAIFKPGRRPQASSPALSCGVWTLPKGHDVILWFFLLRHWATVSFHFDANLNDGWNLS